MKVLQDGVVAGRIVHCGVCCHVFLWLSTLARIARKNDRRPCCQ